MRDGAAVWAFVVALAGLGGCGRAVPPAPADTGAREAVRVYFDGVIAKQWNAIHDALAPESRSRYSREQFARRALAGRKRIPFEPEVCHIRSCQEQGDRALAHVVLTTKTTRHKPRFNDAVVVRRNAGVWRVVLPDTFGR